MTDPRLLKHAKALRKDMTDAERRLWYHLRGHRFEGAKFKRQKPTGPFIVDFVCLESRLVIELDGGQHADDVAYDQRRDAWLAANGYRVLRFWNNEVMQNLPGVLERIRESLVTTDAPSPQPLSRKRERGARAQRLERGAKATRVPVFPLSHVRERVAEGRERVRPQKTKRPRRKSRAVQPTGKGPIRATNE